MFILRGFTRKLGTTCSLDSLFSSVGVSVLLIALFADLKNCRSGSDADVSSCFRSYDRLRLRR